jgi:pristinamycin I synthase-3/4
VEPGEVEACLQRHADVVHAVVTAQPGPDGPRLVAHVQTRAQRPERADGWMDASWLRTHAAAQLPDYMVPVAFHTVREWPRTPNGKVDRKALQALAQEPSPVQVPVTVVQDDTAKALCGIWQRLFGVEQVGLDTDFLALGGDSVLAMRMATSVREQFGVRISPAQVIDRPTIRELAQLLDAAQRDAVPVPARNR